MVLVYHMGVYESKVSTATILGHMADIGKAGVDIFFVISGFVMMMISNRSSKSEDKPEVFLLKRAVRIYPLYWFYTGVALVIFLLRPELANRSGGVGETSIMHSFLLFPDKSGAPIVGQGWTLIHEMYFYLTFSLILFARPSFRGPLLIGWAVVVALFTYAWKPSLNWISPSYRITIELVFSPLTLEFLSGCLVAYISQRKYCSYNMRQASLYLGLFLLLIAGIFNKCHDGTFRELFYGIPAFLIVHGAITMECKAGFLKSRLLTFIGDASYSIYLSHIFCLSFCILVWKYFKSLGLYDNLIALVMMATISLAAGIFSYRFIERPLLRICHNLLKRKCNLPYQPT